MIQCFCRLYFIIGYYRILGITLFHAYFWLVTDLILQTIRYSTCPYRNDTLVDEKWKKKMPISLRLLLKGEIGSWPTQDCRASKHTLPGAAFPAAEVGCQSPQMLGCCGQWCCLLFLWLVQLQSHTIEPFLASPFPILTSRGKVKVKVTESCQTLCHPMDYTVRGIIQARILEWVAFLFSRGSS